MSAVVTPGTTIVAHELVRLPDAEAGLSHQANFTIRFQIQHRSRTPQPPEFCSPNPSVTDRTRKH